MRLLRTALGAATAVLATLACTTPATPAAAADAPYDVLVFSKTSLQRERITPKTPRAIYFNDDLYVGFCLRGDVMEVSASDPNLGTAFYTLDQEPAERPRFVRQTDNCLSCHSSTATQGKPRSWQNVSRRSRCSTLESVNMTTPGASSISRNTRSS